MRDLFIFGPAMDVSGNLSIKRVSKIFACVKAKSSLVFYFVSLNKYIIVYYGLYMSHLLLLEYSSLIETIH